MRGGTAQSFDNFRYDVQATVDFINTPGPRGSNCVWCVTVTGTALPQSLTEEAEAKVAVSLNCKCTTVRVE
jgi:hypothetical protein